MKSISCKSVLPAADQAKPYLSSFQRYGKRTIGEMKLHQHFEFGPASQDPFSFCQIQLALDTVYISAKEIALPLMGERDQEEIIPNYHYQIIS
jgi:hypothetical protein